MIGRNCLFALWAVSSALLGCESGSEESPASNPKTVVAQTTASSLASSAPNAQGGSNRDRALEEVTGSTQADVLIRAYQHKVKQTDGRDDWILLGRSWVQKARNDAEPGYYAYGKAVAELLLERDPDDFLALGLLGQTQLNEHKFAEALASSERALAKSPEDLIALANRSDAELELGRYQAALATTNKLLDLKPAVPAFSRAAHLAWLHGDVEKAKAAWKQAIQIGNNPADPEPRCYSLTQAANLFFHLGDYDGADAGFASALKECTNYPLAMLGKGKVALAKGEPARAVSWLEQGVKLSESIELRWRLGDALVADSKPERAESVFAELVSAGRVEDPRTTAQFLAAHNREPALAVELARNELKTRGGVYAADALAFALYRANEIEEAGKLVDQMLELKTPDSAIEYHAGAILLARGQTERASALLKSALARNPKFDARGAEDAQRLLDQAAGGEP